MRSTSVPCVTAALVAALAGPAFADDALPTVTLTGFPHVHQRPDFCGEAVLEMALRQQGVRTTQDEAFRRSGLDPAKGRGVHADELATALRSYGVEPGPVWYRVDPTRAAKDIDTQWRALHDDLRAGQPSVVCMHYDEQPNTTEHFRLVTGYDARTDEVVYQEPAEADGANRRMPRARFLALWTFRPKADRWLLIRHRVPKSTGVTPLPDETPPLAADVSQHVQTLKETLPKDMTVQWVKPFLVIGNEPPERVAQRAQSVVKWTRDLLLTDFFTEAPAQLEEIWVLKDAPSYERVSRSLFRTEPSTPYGYYLSSRRAQVMNIKPGYGTLVHEMVHPFFHHNWPHTPPWLNEGLASLFEGPYEDRGHLKGRVNWRLPGLQAALRAKATPSFHALTHANDEQFYGDETGVNYAAARYLCLWLQEQGLLVRFVQRAQALKAEDPTGWKALTEVLGKDPDARWAEWARWAQGLSRS